MNYFQYKLEIIDELKGVYTILISEKKSNCIITFSPKTKELKYPEKNKLSQSLKLKEFQLRKLLHNKRTESFYVGFKLNFALHEGLPDTNFYDKTKITILDNTENKFIVRKADTKTPNIIELFTDGSFNHMKSTGGFAILIKTTKNEFLIKQEKTVKKGNNLIELLAVIEGLHFLQHENKIRIITDSQYVIKGITEWLPLWKINNFYTANGTKAKNIMQWRKIDKLVKNKYIEFEWVKSHSDHFENTICDIKAKSIYNIKNEKNK